MSAENQDSSRDRSVSRRGFLGAATAATAGLVVAPNLVAARATSPGYVQGRGPNSNIRGVQIGAITYSYRSMPSSAEQLLGYLVETGISSTELMGPPILEYLGAPTTDAPNQNAINRITDAAEKEAAQRKRTAFEAEMRRWYASPPMEKLAALRKMYNDAGVTIHLAKFAPGADPVASEFAFRASKALGAKGVTNEIGEEVAKVEGPIAAKHGQTAALHNHGQPSEASFVGFDKILALSPGVSLNFDFGHYYGFTGKSPIPEIRKYASRITSFHVKDKEAPAVYGTSGPNVAFGEGSTPIADILRLVQRERWPIHFDIELEYPVPAGSNAVAEMKKCLDYCRDILD